MYGYVVYIRNVSEGKDLLRNFINISIQLMA